ncbi:hypothetical protein DDE18_12320 [Nocardioides gansuensis]|uniref:Uncharacterized protein n=1 Tax=Nocardioides gansuensis TaxID=2138300 RepID=A0A2T8F971_9ACTN|nr:hypothetical protein [Nocardioides gansuensis]PVG82276.1 hypothetical protein DDE18_12320 [Nocardioides gansuensis]
MTEERDEVPLLPSLATDRRLDAQLRDSLRILRDQAEDAELRERIADVLAGRTSLRALARSPEFEAFVTPLARRGWQAWEQMAEDEREQLTEDARTHLDPWG